MHSSHNIFGAGQVQATQGCVKQPKIVPAVHINILEGIRKPLWTESQLNKDNIEGHHTSTLYGIDKVPMPYKLTWHQFPNMQTEQTSFVISAWPIPLHACADLAHGSLKLPVLPIDSSLPTILLGQQLRPAEETLAFIHQCDSQPIFLDPSCCKAHGQATIKNPHFALTSE